MALPVGKGQKVSQYADILGDLVVTTATDDGVIAGEVYSVAPFIVISGITTVKAVGTNLNTFPGWVQGHYVVRKHGDTAAHEWVKGNPLTAIAVGSHDYLQFRVAVAGEPIHAYAFKAAASADTEGQIIGPFMPPFQIVGEGTADAIAAALAALVTGKAAGQILVCDGANGLNVTAWHTELTDGAATKQLTTDGALGATWEAK